MNKNYPFIEDWKAARAQWMHPLVPRVMLPATKALYDDYKIWYEAAGHPARFMPSINVFSNALKKSGIEPKRAAHGTLWPGIILNTEMDN